MLIDANAINKRLTKKLEQNLTVFRMTYAAPNGVAESNPEVFQRGTRKHIENWLAVMEKRGWTLQPGSRPAVYPNGTALDETGIPVLDRTAYVVTARFKHTKSLERSRIELAPGTYKEAPDHTVPVGRPHNKGLSDLVRSSSG